MNALELHAVHKSFGGVPAVQDISLSMPAGSRTAIVGPSGSGKTTLLRMIAGFEFPDRGASASMARCWRALRARCRPISA